MKPTAGSPISPSRFDAELARARANKALEIDLASTEIQIPELGAWDPNVLRERQDPSRNDVALPSSSLAEARVAVANYLAGHHAAVAPEAVFFAPTRPAALSLVTSTVCGADDEVLVPSPALGGREWFPCPTGKRPYALAFHGSWRIEQRLLHKLFGSRTRAIVIGNPAPPTGAVLDEEELAFLERTCADRDAAIIADERELDTAFAEAKTVTRATGCLSFHVSGLSSVCGLPGAGAEWIAVAGPPALVEGAVCRLTALLESTPPPSSAGILALPEILARRQPYLEALRGRLEENRAALAAASLREAPWTLQWGSGGLWAVVQIDSFIDPGTLCLDLLREGVAIRPGPLDGLPENGYLVLSLVCEPRSFLKGLARLEKHLRQFP